MGGLELTIYSIFVAELFLRLLADEFNLAEYCKSSWNVFDVVIVFVSTPWPGWNSKFVLLIRLIRLLRIMRTKSLPQLAVIVNALIIGFASIGYVGIVILMTYYVFAILGVIIFAQNDPFHFRTVGKLCSPFLDVGGVAALLSLFCIVCGVYFSPQIFLLLLLLKRAPAMLLLRYVGFTDFLLFALSLF